MIHQIDWKRKLSSRKLWAAMVGVVTGLAMVFGLDENIISSIAGAVVSVASVVSYIITEGKVDAASVKKAAYGTASGLEGAEKSQPGRTQDGAEGIGPGLHL